MNFWTEQREEQLRNLWADGHSAAFIRQEMRAASRSAILGKVFRLGLPTRETKTRHLDPKPRKASQPRKPARIVSNNNGYVPRADSKPPLPIKLTDIVQSNEFPIVYGRAEAVLSRHAEQCGFPMGAGEQFHYCTNHKADGKHYCDGHHAACWVKPPRHREAV